MRPFIQLFAQLLAPTVKKFHHALQNPELAQLQVQQRLVDNLRCCPYGQTYGVNTREDWNRLPIVTYDELKPWLDRNTSTRTPLTPERILFYEPTSGSSGPIKRIPYTRSLRRAFSHLFCIWAHDLIRNGPHFTTGQIYFSVTPRFTDGEITTGTTDDTDYLDNWLRPLLNPFLLRAPSAKTPAEFQHVLAKTLIKSDRLETISVWSPSFLTAQLNYIQSNRVQLAAELKEDISSARFGLLEGDAPLSAQSSIDFAQLWPNLKLLSCWDSPVAADSAESLRRIFPNTFVQEKGLLATEAPLTVPLIPAQGCLPLLNHVYFEFEDDSGNIVPLHQLEQNKIYEMIISQSGGLSRYRMGDRVTVTHTYKNTPCLQFQGRGPTTIDLVGEKLSLAFVQTVLQQLHLTDSGYIRLIAIRIPRPHYCLVLDRTLHDVARLAHQLEHDLCDSYHYRLARQLGQLQSVRVHVSATIAIDLARHHARKGQRWGDIKHALLGPVYDRSPFG